MDRRIKSTASEQEHGAFLDHVLAIVKHTVFVDMQRSAPVLRWRSPHYLKEILNLQLSQSGASDDELLECLKNIVKYSAKTGHPHFVNQLFSSVDPYGLAGQLITDALNPSVYTYEVAPVLTLMESEVLGNMLQMVGFNNGEGIFCPGGSLANGFAINLARYHLDPSFKKKGMVVDPRLVVLTSEDAHYSIYKMAGFMGIGEGAVISVNTDAMGRMDPQELRLKLQDVKNKGFRPFLIFATAGTTVLGSFDPLEELAVVAQEYSAWLHVDAAWGGGALFSKKHRHLLKGIHLADSVTWNPHKMLSVPQQCSVLLVRQHGLLLECHRRNADYLFQKDKFYDTKYDVGDQYLQCGRRADVLKFWLMWKAKGADGLEQHVDHLMEVSHHLLTRLKSRPRFVLVAEPQFVNVCFWFVPEKLSKLQHHPDYLHMLHKVAPRIKEGMLRRGSLMINYQPLRQWPNFFRFVTQNSEITKDDADFFLNEIERLGFELDSSQDVFSGWRKGRKQN